jgi:hypothetical protein
MRYRHRQIIKVWCSKCKEWVDEEKTVFINIEEGGMGEDILTFECPICKTEQKSKRIG